MFFCEFLFSFFGIVVFQRHRRDWQRLRADRMGPPPLPDDGCGLATDSVTIFGTPQEVLSCQLFLLLMPYAADSQFVLVT